MNKTYRDCYGRLDGNTLRLGTSKIERAYRWNGGDICTESIADKAAGTAWTMTGKKSDAEFPGEDCSAPNGQLTAEIVPETAFTPEHLQVSLTTEFGTLQVRRRFRLYPETAAIACDYFLRGTAQGDWSVRTSDSSDRGQIEDSKTAAEGDMTPVTIERIDADLPHVRLRSVQFFDVTDWRNTLVKEQEDIPFMRTSKVVGQLLFLQDTFSDRRLFVLKEAPCTDIQLAGDGYDFISQGCGFRAVGLGLEANDISPDAWTRAYGFVTGVATGSEYEILKALRDYKQKLRVLKPDRDHMIMQNTWGDRGQDTKLGESFTIAELDAGARLGVTHLQLDDGWQKGLSHNSAFGGSFDGIWEKGDFWDVNPERFPNGLAPVRDKADDLGIELCLWFNPCIDDSYANWENDADRLVELYHEHGVRTFKLDGVRIPDKTADVNFRAMLDKVMAATNNEAVFNLDVTAGKRGGYHYLNEYGNIFVENRYTDWSNYYPHWTLRNIWQLSRYVPSSSLQFEFLNKWRNPEKYRADDPLAPRNVPFEYCFAVTMMTQPLAWFEGSSLPEEAFKIAPVLATYKVHQRDMHCGTVLPIGQEPSGTSWTGFQSIMDDTTGYIAVYREMNQEGSGIVKLWNCEGKTLKLTPVIGHDTQTSCDVDQDGKARFELPEPFSYALYQYQID